MPSRLRLLLRAGLRLAAVAVRLRTGGFGATRRWLRRGRSAPLAAPAGTDEASRAADVAWAVASAARLSPLHPACLTRALTLWSLLYDAGIEGRVCLGARQAPVGLLAHAWVEVNGCVLNDDPDIAERFPPLVPPPDAHRHRAQAADTLS